MGAASIFLKQIPSALEALILIILGYFVAKFISSSVAKAFRYRFTPHSVMLFKRFIFYLIFTLFFVSAVQQLGFNIGTLLGAAGILTAAIGFASQTSMSNVISGLFIIGEKPFGIGDVIKVNDMQGEVTRIDLLSVKIRTPDNTLIRIPNETLVKSAITNLSHFPSRRADLIIGIPYTENLDKVKDILLSAAQKNKYVLDDPKPSLSIQNVQDGLIYFQVSAWSDQNKFSDMKNSLQEDIQVAFAKNEIKLSLTTRPVLFEGASKPLEVKLI